MKTKYKLKNDLDLTFDEISIKNEDISEVPEHLRPTQAMQDRFLQNCFDRGLLEEV